MQTFAKEIMSSDVLVIRQGTSVEEALKILLNHRITGLPVVDEEDRMIGVVSEYDIIRQLAGQKKLRTEHFGVPVEFSKEVTAVKTETELSEVVKLFVNLKYRRLPVLDDHGKLAGIITRRDLMRVFYYRARLA